MCTIVIKPTSTNIGVDLNTMSFTIDRLDRHLHVGKDQRLTLPVIGSDRGKEGNSQFNRIIDSLRVYTLCSSVFVVCLSNQIAQAAHSTHPVVSGTINPNQALPAKRSAIPEGGPLTGKVASITTTTAGRLPGTEVR